MISEETLLILGAGAGKPYGYPTGRELRNYISKRFPIDFSVIMQNHKGLENQYKIQANRTIQKFAETFNKSAVLSIDRWLAMNPEFSHTGKIAIATSILKSENESRFWEDVEEPSQDWYLFLYNKMTEGFSSPKSYEKFKENKVTFITFNYDRSLEHFLFTSLCCSFTQESVEHVILLSPSQTIIPFPFIHVYGQIDEPRWKRGSPYAEKIDWDKIERLARNIKIIGERGQRQDEYASGLFQKARRIFFLGFGFAPENMKALGLPGSLGGNKRIYGTVFGFTPKEILQVRDSIRRGAGLSSSSVILEDVDSYKLLREYL